MKSFLFVACLTLVQGAPSPDADADADPALYYSTGYNYPYTTYHHAGVHNAAVVPKVVSPVAAVVPSVHAAFSHGVVTSVVHQAVVKEVEVTPTEVETNVTPVTHTSPYNFGFFRAYPYATGAYPFSPYTTASLATVSVAGAPRYVANSGGAVHIVNKRDADADPALYYSTHYNYPYTTYHHGGIYNAAAVPTAVSPVAAVVPNVHAAFPHGLVTPVVHQAVVKEVEVTPVTHIYTSPYNFGFSGAYPYTTGAYPFAPYATGATISAVSAIGAPGYVANSGGAVHIVNKRDADADPGLYYSTHYNYPYNTYHHGGVYNAAAVPTAVSPVAAVVPTVHAAFPHGVVTPVVHQAVVKEVQVTPVEVETNVTPVTHIYTSPYNFGFSGAYPYTTGAYPFASYATGATVSAVSAAGLPRYVANSGGVVHVVNKREADPEADADAYYHYGYGHHLGYSHGYGYSRRAYSGYSGYPYGFYNRGHYGYHY